MTQVVDQHFADILDNMPKLLTKEEVGPKLHRFLKHYVEELLSANARTEHTQ